MKDESYNESYDLVKEIIEDVFRSDGKSGYLSEEGVEIVAPDGTFEAVVRELGLVPEGHKFITEMSEEELQKLDKGEGGRVEDLCPDEEDVERN